MAVGRMSFPTLPVLKSSVTPSQSPKISLEEACDRLAAFLKDGRGNTLILTGAGASTDSGIQAYRGEQGYPPVQVAKPNPTHYSLAALHALGYWNTLITQNVDGLHQLAFPKKSKDAEVLELHGSLRHVHCTECGHDYARDDIQERLSEVNPDWAEYATEISHGGKLPRMNPDGDAEIHNRGYETFNIVDCSLCGGPLKPSVIFFGESLPKSLKETSFNRIESTDQLLIIGSALATFSAYRLVIQAREAKKPIALINVGPSRADALAPTLRLDMKSSDVLRTTARNLLGQSKERTTPTASTNIDHEMIRTLLEHGVSKGSSA